MFRYGNCFRIRVIHLCSAVDLATIFSNLQILVVFLAVFSETTMAFIYSSCPKVSVVVPSDGNSSTTRKCDGTHVLFVHEFVFVFVCSFCFCKSVFGGIYPWWELSAEWFARCMHVPVQNTPCYV